MRCWRERRTARILGNYLVWHFAVEDILYFGSYWEVLACNWLYLYTALEFTNITRFTSIIKSQTATFSVCNIQANAWQTDVQRTKTLPRHLSATQSMYSFDSLSNFVKQAGPVRSSDGLVIPTRSVNSRNKHGKPKTVKAVAKRFFRTGNGQLKYWPPGKNHNMMKKGPRKSRKLRQPRLCNKQQLKLLNKMLGRYC